jgi:hypothetical protein
VRVAGSYDESSRASQARSPEVRWGFPAQPGTLVQQPGPVQFGTPERFAPPPVPVRRALPFRVVGLVTSDARAAGLPRWWAWWMFWVPLLGSVVVGGLRLDWPVYLWLLKEDHPVEWAQFGVMLFSTLVLAAVLGSALRRRDVPVVLLAGLMFLAFLFTTGEEISWGQRVLGLATPQSLAGMNGQDELNVHDIRVGIPVESVINFSEMLFAVLAAVLPWLVRVPASDGVFAGRTAWLRARWLRLACPPPYAAAGFLLMAGYRFARFFLLPPSVEQSATVVVLKQWMEAGFYLSLTAMVVSLVGRLRQSQRQRRRHRQSRHPDRAATGGGTLRPLLPYAVLAAVTTVVFAVLTIHSGIAPGN